MDVRALIMGVVFALMWSSAFTSARVIVAHAPPLTTLAIRFLLSGLIAIAIARAMGETMRLTAAQWRATVIFGICQNTLYLGLNFVAMQTVEASLAAIIASALPLFVGLAGWLLFGERLALMGIAGLIAGFAGVGLIMGSRLGAGVDLVGVALCVIAVLALTFATLALRGAFARGNLMTMVGLQMLVGCASLSVLAVIFEDWQFRWSWQLGVAFAYTVLVPGVAATWIWFALVERIGGVRAATFHFLNPVFGVAIAAVLLGEALGPLDVIGVIIVTGGILAVQLARRRGT